MPHLMSCDKVCIGRDYTVDSKASGERLLVCVLPCKGIHLRAEANSEHRKGHISNSSGKQRSGDHRNYGL